MAVVGKLHAEGRHRRDDLLLSNGHGSSKEIEYVKKRLVELGQDILFGSPKWRTVNTESAYMSREIWVGAIPAG